MFINFILTLCVRNFCLEFNLLIFCCCKAVLNCTDLGVFFLYKLSQLSFNSRFNYVQFNSFLKFLLYFDNLKLSTPH